MIAQYYGLIYIIIVILFAIPVLFRYSSELTIYNTERGDEPITNSLLFTIIIILFIGLRPNSPVFADGVGYWQWILDHRWEYYSLEDVNYQFATKWLISFMSSHHFPPRLGFFIYAIIIYGGALLAMRKLYPRDTLLAMILFCGTFGAFSGAVNGIKSSMACSMFICALAYKDNWKACLFFLIVSFGFHHSLELSIGAFIVCSIYKKTGTYYMLWGASLIIAALNITYFQTLLAGATDEHGAKYLLTDDDSWVTGFRPDFVLYSLAPLALGWWVKTKVIIQNTKYEFFLNVYLVMNSIWLLCMYASYTNRIAGLSWTLFPLLILEPLINEKINNNQHRILSWFIIGQLSFSLLMAVISTISATTIF